MEDRLPDAVVAALAERERCAVSTRPLAEDHLVSASAALPYVSLARLQSLRCTRP